MRTATVNIADRIKPFLPPIVLPLVRSLVGLIKRPEWEYVPQGWAEDDPRGLGWHHSSVVEAQQRRWPDFVKAVTDSGTLGVSHEAVQIESHDIFNHNILLTFAYALGRAAAGRNTLSVLDWGGGIGYYALIARQIFPEIHFDYHIEEIPSVCVAGRQVMPDVRFTENEGSLGRSYDLVFMSSSLQYSRNWQALVGRLDRAATHWMFLTRLPITDYESSYVVSQRPYWAGYRTEYISWVFSRHELLAEATARSLVLEREFLVRSPSKILRAPSEVYERGFLFKKQLRCES